MNFVINFSLPKRKAKLKFLVLHPDLRVHISFLVSCTVSVLGNSAFTTRVLPGPDDHETSLLLKEDKLLYLSSKMRGFVFVLPPPT